MLYFAGESLHSTIAYTKKLWNASMKKLNFKQIEMLWSIITAGSISTAARQLDVSQPAISRMLAQTEAQLDMKLFERIRGRLRPSKELTDLLPEIERAQKALQRVNDMMSAMSEAQGGVLRVSSNPSLAKHVIPKALDAFHKLYPDTFLRFHTAMISDLVAELLSGEIDIAVLAIPAEHPFLSTTSICEGSMVAIAPKDWPLAANNVLSLRELAQAPHILVGERLHYGMIAANAFKHAGVQPNVIADVPWSDLAYAMVNQGIGCAIVDAFSVTEDAWPNVKAIPLDTHIPIRMHAVHATNRPLPEVAKRFLRVVKSLHQTRGKSTSIASEASAGGDARLG
ncbi:LysR family transcriptional regulator [Allopusillimonas soli]|nr:LysR family transcriptional regulator [Allopusillimonas soli]